MDLRQIYTQIIQEHNGNTCNKHPLDHPTVTKAGVNPSCGDEITIELKLEDNKITDATFTGYGCAISQASTDIMIELIKGKTVEEAKKLSELFMQMIHKEVEEEEALEPLGDAAALKDISHMPARVKCAVLGWRTLNEMI